MSKTHELWLLKYLNAVILKRHFKSGAHLQSAVMYLKGESQKTPAHALDVAVKRMKGLENE